MYSVFFPTISPNLKWKENIIYNFTQIQVLRSLDTNSFVSLIFIFNLKLKNVTLKSVKFWVEHIKLFGSGALNGEMPIENKFRGSFIPAGGSVTARPYPYPFP